MGNGNYCSGVMVGVGCKAYPSYDFWEEDEVCDMHISITKPLCGENWVI